MCRFVRDFGSYTFWFECLSWKFAMTFSTVHALSLLLLLLSLHGCCHELNSFLYELDASEQARILKSVHISSWFRMIVYFANHASFCTKAFRTWLFVCVGNLFVCLFVRRFWLAGLALALWKCRWIYIAGTESLRLHLVLIEFSGCLKSNQHFCIFRFICCLFRWNRNKQISPNQGTSFGFALLNGIHAPLQTSNWIN